MRRRLAALAFTLAAVALAVAVSVPPVLGNGLPSFRRGVFHTATLGYYMETAMLLSSSGWWTSCWCGGFQDLIRFYPPLGNVLLYAVLKATGSFEAAASIGMMVALMLLSIGVIYFGSRVVGKMGVVVGLLALLGLEAWVATISVYWEYTRIMGDGLALIALGAYYDALMKGREEGLVTAGALMGITVLTSLISTVWLAAAVVVLTIYMLSVAWRSGVPEAVLYPLRGLAVAALAAAAVAGWWVVPALLPWGVGHYLRVRTPLSLKLHVLSLSLRFYPPLWAPAIQLPLLALSAAAAVLARRRGSPLPLVVAAVAALVLVYGQGLRLVPVLGLMLVYAAAWLWEGGGRWERLVSLVVALVLVFYAVHYYPDYAGKLHMDYTFLGSDEYIVSQWLNNVIGGRCLSVYGMYGPRLHMNQWLNVFAPRVRQVLTGFQEGCLNPLVYRLDYLVKSSLDVNETYRLLRRLHVAYVVVDRVWMNATRPNVVELLAKRGLLSPVAEVNRVLRYSLVYRVKGVEPGDCRVYAPFWTPARLLGLAVSLAAVYILASRRPRYR